MQVGETVRLYWVSRNTTYTSQKTVTDTAQLLRFIVPKYELIDAIGYESTRVHYTVKRGATDPELSAILSVNVEGNEDELPFEAPTLNTGHDNIRVSKNKRAEITPTTTVEVRGIGATEWQSGTKTFGSADYVNFPIPSPWLESNKGRSVLFNYSLRLRPSDGNVYRFSRLLRINPF